MSAERCVSITTEGVLTGTISHIEKNATVMVKDPRGLYQDRTGQRYTKYRVPLEQLSPFQKETSESPH